MTATAWTALEQFLTPPERAHLPALRGYLEILLQWNQKTNLTAENEEELVQLHVREGVEFTRAVADLPLQDVLDLGTGNGLPALIFRILRPEPRLTLVETKRKKVSFLNAACARLSLPRVSVFQKFLEMDNLPAEWLGAFDLVFSRATLAPGDWLQLGMKMTRPGGTVAVFGFQDAIKTLAAQTAPDRVRRHEYVLPGSPRARSIGLFQRA